MDRQMDPPGVSIRASDVPDVAPLDVVPLDVADIVPLDVAHTDVVLPDLQHTHVQHTACNAQLATAKWNQQTVDI